MAFKFELRLNGEQSRLAMRFAGCCRYVYNKALAAQIQNHSEGEKYLSYQAMTKFLPLWKSESDSLWLKDCHSQVLQQSLKHLDSAFQNFFAKRAAFPKFKKKGRGDAFRFPQIAAHHFDSANQRIRLPMIGWVRFRKSREVVGDIKNVTVSRTGEKWFLSIQTEQDIEQPLPQATSAIGLDVGVARFVTDSNGHWIAPSNALKQKMAKLARYQRAMARKRKFSANWRKAKAKVTRLHIQIGNTRRDFLHKASTAYSQNHAMIAVEALNVKNMASSAKGTVEEPGTNVKAKAGLNRAILDQGWGEFIRQLQYKSQWAGGELIEVAPHHTSQSCPACGHVHKDNRKTQAKFACTACGYENNADHVAAMNVLTRAYEKLAAGHAVSACGAKPLGSALKQEPTEETIAV